jgi:tRNA 2-selenouridine synthase
VIIEGESKRIGKVSLPGDMYEVMRESVKVWCAASLETRVSRLIVEYGIPEYREEMTVALDRIRKRLGGEKYTEIAGYLDRWEMEPFMAELIRQYYDKVYYKTRDWVEDFTLSLEDFGEAARELDAFLRRQFVPAG